MTVQFDKKAQKHLETRNTLFDGCKYEGQKVKDMVVENTTVNFARPYIATYHYSQSMPDSTRFVFAGYLGNALAGIITYGMGSNHSQYAYLIPDIEKGEYLEITRIWSPDDMPKNTESKLIAESLKMLPKKVRLIVTFADEMQNHQGYIYQASNFYYCGMTEGGNMMVDKEGNVKHPKSINIYKMRHSELNGKTSKEIMNIYGWKYIEGGRKHRYCMLRGNKTIKRVMYEQIKDKIKPYPKGE